MDLIDITVRNLSMIKEPKTTDADYTKKYAKWENARIYLSELNMLVMEERLNSIDESEISYIIGNSSKEFSNLIKPFPGWLIKYEYQTFCKMGLYYNYSGELRYFIWLYPYDKI